MKIQVSVEGVRIEWGERWVKSLSIITRTRKGQHSKRPGEERRKPASRAAFELGVYRQVNTHTVM